MQQHSLAQARAGSGVIPGDGVFRRGRLWPRGRNQREGTAYRCGVIIAVRPR